MFVADLQRGVVRQSQSSPHPVVVEPQHLAQPAGLHVPTDGPLHALVSLQDGIRRGEQRGEDRAGGSRQCHVTTGTLVKFGAIQLPLQQQQRYTGEERRKAW